MAEYANDEQSDPVLSGRRRFLKIAIGALTFMSGAVLGLPFVRTIIRSAPPKMAGWSEVTKISALPLGKPSNVKFPAESGDAFIHGSRVQAIWAIKHSEREVTVFSPVCTHLGCYFAWNEKNVRFECPCHASVFSLEGKVLGGPAPRPLDSLPYRIEGDTLLIKWEQYKSGVAEKIPV